MQPPLDPRRYRRHRESRLVALGIPDGTYVYVQASDGVIHILPAGPHRRPRILGNAEPARYAGDFAVAGDVIVELTNISGTFQFDDAEGLLMVAGELETIGFRIAPGSVRLFSHIDGRRPVVLR